MLAVLTIGGIDMATLVFTLVALVFSGLVAVGAKALARRGRKAQATVVTQPTQRVVNEHWIGGLDKIDESEQLALMERYGIYGVDWYTRALTPKPADRDTSEWDRSTQELPECDLSEAELAELDAAIMRRWMEIHMHSKEPLL